MISTKKQYEEKIANTKLFEIDKEKDSQAYASEYRKMLELCSEYFLLFIYEGESQYQKEAQSFMGEIFISTFKACVKYYDCQKATENSFLGYLTKAIKNNMYRAKTREQKVNCRSAITGVPKLRQINNLMRFIGERGLDINDNTHIKKCAEFMKCTEADILLLINTNKQLTVLSTKVRDENDEEVDSYDFVKDYSPNPEETMLGKERSLHLLDIMQNIFENTQNRDMLRQKNSMIMTNMVLNAGVYNIDKLNQLAKEYSFLHKKMILYFGKSSKMLTARKIAEVCGVVEQDISRTANKIKNSIKELM